MYLWSTPERNITIQMRGYYEYIGEVCSTLGDVMSRLGIIISTLGNVCVCVCVGGGGGGGIL